MRAESKVRRFVQLLHRTVVLIKYKKLKKAHSKLKKQHTALEEEHSTLKEKYERETQVADPDCKNDKIQFV